MRILPNYKYHPKIEIIEIMGELTGRGAIRLEEFLYNCLDKDKCYVLIDLGLVKRIDGMGIAVLEYFVKRGMHIRLFNIRPLIRDMIKVSGKEDFLDTYKEKDCDISVSLFEKEISEEKDRAKDGIIRRRHPRVNTSFPKEFHYHSGHNGKIHGKAHILNLSESGIFADRIITINTKTGGIVNDPKIAGRELHELRFELNGSSKLIETSGECVWEAKKFERLCAGIRFKDIGQDHKEMIRDYVYESIQSKDKS